MCTFVFPETPGKKRFGYHPTRTDIVSRPKLDQRGRIDLRQISPEFISRIIIHVKATFSLNNITVVKTWVPQANCPVQ